MRLFTLVLFLLPVAAYSTHLRGGQIRVVSTDGLTCHIEMRLLTNTGSEIVAGEGLFDFGDGTSTTTQSKLNTILPGQPGVGLVVYEFNHTYSAPGNYILSYTEPNLTGGILNMTNSIETRFYIESSVVVSLAQHYSSPNFQTEPIFVCPSRRPYSFSTAAIDDSTSNDFLYTYELVAEPKLINGYVIPENLTIHKDNGVISWDTKFNGNYLAGMFWVVVRINRYSKTGGYQGYVSRAMQILVEDSDSKIDLTSSITDSSNKVVILEGQEKKIKVVLSDNDEVDTLYLDLYFNKIIKDNISITQYDSAAGDRKIRVAILSLKTTHDALSDLPYPVTLRGNSTYRKDITFLYMTRNVDLPNTPPPPPVVTGLLDEKEFRIYPNPFRSELYIEETTSTEATFINSFGQIVMKSRLQKGQPVNTMGLPAGLYILQITGKDGVSNTLKLVHN
ncbi:MAG TPA: T9SS type A sorting domain-containing protein [Cyclobacteriaceae bacterium]|nr:T9SS type A sorting domain-containing protein [Cyclobacteriaceae bacterium]